MARYGYWVLVAVGGIGLVVASVLAFTVPHPLGPVAPIAWVAGAALPESATGSGIVGLRDRVESIGGKLQLDSRPDAGTTLRATLPVNATSSAHV